jgi:hypothetical protein
MTRPCISGGGRKSKLYARTAFSYTDKLRVINSYRECGTLDRSVEEVFGEIANPLKLKRLKKLVGRWTRESSHIGSAGTTPPTFHDNNSVNCNHEVTPPSITALTHRTRYVGLRHLPRHLFLGVAGSLSSPSAWRFRSFSLGVFTVSPCSGSGLSTTGNAVCVRRAVDRP